MSRFLAWVLATAATVGMATPAVADDPPAATESRPWYKKMFSSSPKPAGPTVRSGPVAAAPGRAPTPTLTPEVIAEAVKAEYLAWNRRMDVCNKLKEAALARNDDALWKQVDELERQANAIYQQRVSALGVPKYKAPLPPAAPSTGFAASFDLAPTKPEDPKAAAARLVAPAAPVPVSGTAEVREVRP